MATYKIIGGDQKEYGPITAEQIRYWIGENRLNAQSQAREEGAEEWKTLGAFPEFAEALGLGADAPEIAAPAGAAPAPIEDVSGRDYDLSIGDCFSRAWALVKVQFGLLFAGTLIYFAIEMGIGVLGAIPVAGALFSLANVFVVGPLLGGLYYMYLLVIRKQPARASDIFSGFRMAYVPLFLGNLVPGILCGICFLPVIAVGMPTVIPAIAHRQMPPPGPLAVLVGVGVLCAIPMIFLQTNWLFTLPLIIDKNMGFWTAMKTSWTKVLQHWWRVFGLVVLVGLVNLGGLAVCCVGLLFTLPLSVAAMMFAYETIFGPAQAQP